MVVGESGLGKSTLVNSLFLTDLYPERIIPGAVGKFSFNHPDNRKYFISITCAFFRKTKANR